MGCGNGGGCAARGLGFQHRRRRLSGCGTRGPSIQAPPLMQDLAMRAQRMPALPMQVLWTRVPSMRVRWMPAALMPGLSTRVPSARPRRPTSSTWSSSRRTTRSTPTSAITARSDRLRPTCTTGPAAAKPPSKRIPASARPRRPRRRRERRLRSHHQQACEIAEIDDGDGLCAATAGPDCGSPRTSPRPRRRSGPVLGPRHEERPGRPLLPARGRGELLERHVPCARAASSSPTTTTAGPTAGRATGARRTAHLHGPDDRRSAPAATVELGFYAVGLRRRPSQPADSRCPAVRRAALAVHAYPCIYDPSDNPFEYYEAFRDDPETSRTSRRSTRVATVPFPACRFVKAMATDRAPGSGRHSRRTLVTTALDAIMRSPYAATP